MQTPPSVKSLAEAYSSIQIESIPEPVFEAMEDVLQNEAQYIEEAIKKANSASKYPERKINPHRTNSALHYSHEADYHTSLANHFSKIANKTGSKKDHARAANAHSAATHHHLLAHDTHHLGAYGYTNTTHANLKLSKKHGEMSQYHASKRQDHEEKAGLV